MIYHDLPIANGVEHDLTIKHRDLICETDDICLLLCMFFQIMFARASLCWPYKNSI